jgi:hypothetical protein
LRTLPDKNNRPAAGVSVAASFPGAARTEGNSNVVHQMNQQAVPSEPGDSGAPVSFFHSIWVGRAKLWRAFWLIGVVGFVLSLVLSAVAVMALYTVTHNEWIVSGIPAALVAAYLVYALVGVWRCAPNTSFPAWTALAKTWVILWPVWLIVKAIKAT